MQKKNGDAPVYSPDEEYARMLEALKGFCDEKGITMNGLARQAGISTSTMSYLIHGKTRPQIYTLLVICNVLGISITELFREEAPEKAGKEAGAKKGERARLSPSESHLLSCYRKLSDKKKRMLQTYLDMLLQYKE